MLKHFLTIVIFLLVAVDSHAAGVYGPGETPPDVGSSNSNNQTPYEEPDINTEEDLDLQDAVLEPARIRGDGMLIDADGLIIGIRNLKDSRATAYTYYYYGVSRDGEVTTKSKYRVFQNPEVTWADFVMQDLYPEPPKDASKIIALSRNNKNVIYTFDNNIYANGKKVKSGGVVSGGVVTLIKKKLKYNGIRIESGTKVKNGKIISR